MFVLCSVSNVGAGSSQTGRVTSGRVGAMLQVWGEMSADVTFIRLTATTLNMIKHKIITRQYNNIKLHPKLIVGM